MPNSFAHYLVVHNLFTKEEKFNRENSNAFLKNNSEYLYLGTQGPDPLFFGGIIPFHGLHLLTAKKKLGNKLHRHNPHRFFRLLIDQSYLIEDDRFRKKFQAYIFGQFAHYLLDRETHPFIIYNSGFDENGKITKKYHYYHAAYETEIDMLLAKKYGFKSFLDNPSEILPSDKQILKVIDTSLIPALKLYFNDKKIPKNYFSNSLSNMKRMIRWENKNGKFKRKFFGKTRLTSLSINKDALQFEDALNEKKNIWLNPVTGEKSRESFIELQSKAMTILNNLYNDILKNGFNFDVFARYINGLDYYGFTPKSVWKHKKESK